MSLCVYVVTMACLATCILAESRTRLKNRSLKTGLAPYPFPTTHVDSMNGYLDRWIDKTTESCWPSHCEPRTAVSDEAWEATSLRRTRATPGRLQSVCLPACLLALERQLFFGGHAEQYALTFTHAQQEEEVWMLLRLNWQSVDAGRCLGERGQQRGRSWPRMM